MSESREIKHPCICGFMYPFNPQNRWTEEEYKSVAAHQQAHILSERKAKEQA